MTARGISRASIAQWGCLTVIIGVIILTVVGGVWLFTRSPSEPSGARPTATVWTTTPTAPIQIVQPTSTPQQATLGQIRIGIRVKVTGTGNAGLSIRTAPGTNAERIDIAKEGETFLVVNGPKDADGFRWWLLRDELNPQREGWAAADYLTPAE